MKLIKFLLLLPAAFLAANVCAQNTLDFDARSGGEERILTFPDGYQVKYRAFENIPYVTHVEDPAHQCLNLFVPESAYDAGKGTPVFLRNYVSGYAAALPKQPDVTDASGRALREGYVLCIPGARGSNSTVEVKKGKKTETVYTGGAPNGLLDLKAAVRFLRYNDATIPGDSERIISDGASAGGAMSSLLGATGNDPVYAPYLEAMGAAQTRDDVFASIVYCPIIDLDHADMAYEWLLGSANGTARNKTEAQQEVSAQLAAGYPAYINSLGLKHPVDGTPLTADNYKDYIKSYLVKSIQRARFEGAEIPDTIGVVFKEAEKRGMMGGPGMGPGGNGPQGRPQGNMGPGGNGPQGGPGGMMRGPMKQEQPEYVVDLDLDKYIAYVGTTQPLKNAPAYDAMGVLGARESAENKVFGDAAGTPANFTDFSLRLASGRSDATVDEAMKHRVYLYNPLNFVGKPGTSNAAYWYIRQGARDATFFNPVTLATKLMNCGYEVDFAFTWNRPHSADFGLDSMFDWIESLLK